jgi:hypothetical protein
MLDLGLEAAQFAYEQQEAALIERQCSHGGLADGELQIAAEFYCAQIAQQIRQANDLHLFCIALFQQCL